MSNIMWYIMKEERTKYTGETPSMAFDGITLSALRADGFRRSASPNRTN